MQILLVPYAYSNSVLLSQEISDSPTWHGLIHYEKAVLSNSKSTIVSDDFFFSKSGASSPELELQATLNAFISTPQEQCRFPARSLFLKKYFKNIPQVECEEFNAYIESVDSNSISLIYASGYLGNPASMYGHIFLKFNSNNSNELLDNTFNYGARYPKDENPITYIFKGIFGGYKGYYANQKYHHQTLTYSESELRDLWEYKLSLPEESIKLILAHLYELENTPTTYYFFTQNCAYQIAKLLEMVTHDSYIQKSKAWVLPYDVVDQATLSQDGNFITDVEFHASRQEALFSKFSQLDRSEKHILSNVVGQYQGEVKALLVPLAPESAKQIIDVAYDYYAYLDKKNKGLSEEQKRRRKALLSYALSLPLGKPKFTDVIRVAPHEAQNTTLLQVSSIFSEAHTDALELRFRANYYDLLSVNAARIPFSELSTIDLKVRVEDNVKLTLEEFTLLKIISLNPSVTSLPDDRNLAWKLAIGYRDIQIDDIDNRALYIDGFVGKSLLINHDFTLYGAVSASLLSNDDAGGNLAVGPELGGVLNVSPGYSISLQMRYQTFTNDLEQGRFSFDFEQRFFNHQRFDVRASIRRNVGTEALVSLSYYY